MDPVTRPKEVYAVISLRSTRQGRKRYEVEALSLDPEKAWDLRDELLERAKAEGAEYTDAYVTKNELDSLDAMVFDRRSLVQRPRQSPASGPIAIAGDSCGQAARNGELATLQALRAAGAQWDRETCAGAALEGHLEILQWARAQNPPCPWDELTCAWAAEGGHLGALQWARAQNPPCPWDGQTCANATGGGHFELLRWAVEHGCPWDREICLMRTDGKNSEMARWIAESG